MGFLTTVPDTEVLALIVRYIKPELIVLAVALYVIGIGLKKMETVSDKKIPLILGVIGVIQALMYVFATTSIVGYQDLLMALFSACIQGVLCAAAPVYVSQLIIQAKKEN